MPDQQFSLMSGEEVKNEGLVADGQDSLYQPSTYDLSIGEIIPAGSHATSITATSEYKLPPGGVVRVVSRESLQMPNDITGHVLLRNGLCRMDVLAINIGVVDPGYCGPLSSTLINFGRREFLVRKGQPFLRVSFHRCQPSAKSATSPKLKRAEYLERTRLEVGAFSASTFLNVEETSDRAAQRVFGKFTNSVMTWVGIAAVLFTLITLLVPLGASYVQTFVDKRDKRAEAIEKKLEDQNDQLKTLSDHIAELQKSVAAKAARQ
jgi:deoxycytidine triphosphate deaminase